MIPKVKEMKARYFTNELISPKFVIIHHTGSLNDLSQYCANPSDGRQISVHFHITRDGVITRYTNLINFSEPPRCLRAWHTKSSGRYTSHYEYKGVNYQKMNSCTIGIELAGTNTSDYTNAQYQSLIWLSRYIMNSWNVLKDPYRWIGHRDVQGDKADPNDKFKWDYFRGELAKVADGVITMGDSERNEILNAYTILWELIATSVPVDEREGNKYVAAFNKIRELYEE